eukprot:TRINITY_DN2957_c0_g1_i2.p1 TRINITY_DN2957_c0_g1~~TRINITY_DN2957_c0_g1_i2.p1  ORF type:complete len:512 (+),score=91.97 TRINITY_DN2957_c0_g1_i2:67-1602(+)
MCIRDRFTTVHYVHRDYKLFSTKVVSGKGSTKVKNLFEKHDSVVAWGVFNNTINKTGWSSLTIFTNSRFRDTIQYMYAGYLEGFVTYELIWAAYNNFRNSVLEGKDIPTKAQEFVTEQNNWLAHQMKAQKQDRDFWASVEGLMTQVRGMWNGYIHAVKAANETEKNLSFDLFYYLTNMGDLEDIVPAFSYHPAVKNPAFSECSAFIRLVNGSLLTGHNTYNIYPLMLRVFKSYQFGLSNKGVVSSTISFTSRPGDLQSKDDFYMTNSGLVVLETSLNNYNLSNYHFLTPQSVPSWMRVIIATRLAQNASHWAQLFSIHRSGTHNNQWLAVDYNQLGTEKPSNFVVMAEEFYSLYAVRDFTDDLLKNGYVAGYNVPYNQSIYDVSGYGNNWGANYFNDTRAILFQKYAEDVKTVDDMKAVMRMNRNETGEPCYAIAPRCDLSNDETLVMAFGAIDAKIIDEKMLNDQRLLAVSSPTTDDQTPFSFTGKWANTPHMLLPETMNFDWVTFDLKY